MNRKLDYQDEPNFLLHVSCQFTFNSFLCELSQKSSSCWRTNSVNKPLFENCKQGIKENEKEKIENWTEIDYAK